MIALQRSTLVGLVLLVGMIGVAQVGIVVAADPPAKAAAGAKLAEFNKLFMDWKGMLGKLRQLRDDYRQANRADKPAIEKQYNQLLEQAEAMQSGLIDAAKAAFIENPTEKANIEAADFLLGTMISCTQHDDYEAVVRLGNLLIEKKYPRKDVYGFVGLAAYMTDDLETAEKYLKMVEKDDFVSKFPKELQTIVEEIITEPLKTKQRWQKEQAIRDAEAKANNLPRVLIKTSKGDIEVELFENEASNTVANFVSLVEAGFYNGTAFHRVLPQFMAQGGDPKGDGTGGPGYTIACECYEPNHREHYRGSLSMANTGQPNTGGSQFFLTFVPTHYLDGRHTVFGRVIKGFEVLAKLQRRNPEQGDNIPDPDRILEAKVLRKRAHPYTPKKVEAKEG